MTIYEKNPGGLITTGSRTVSTFPSGLVRVDQSFACATSSASTHRQSFMVGEPMPGDDDSPAVDGLYIATVPSEVRTTTGFTEFPVSAYGRTTKIAPELVMIPERMSHGNSWGDFDFSVWKVSGSIVIPANTMLSVRDLGIKFDDDFLLPFDIVNTSLPEQALLSVTSGIITEDKLYYKDISAADGSGNYSAFTFRTKPASRRVYNVQMTVDGVTPTSTFALSVSDPRIKYTAYRIFGKFMEIDFESTRSVNLQPE